MNKVSQLLLCGLARETLSAFLWELQPRAIPTLISPHWLQEEAKIPSRWEGNQTEEQEAS